MLQETQLAQLVLRHLDNRFSTMRVPAFHPFASGKQLAGRHHRQQIAHHFGTFCHEDTFLPPVFLLLQRADEFQFCLADHAAKLRKKMVNRETRCQKVFKKSIFAKLLSLGSAAFCSFLTEKRTSRTSLTPIFFVILRRETMENLPYCTVRSHCDDSYELFRHQVCAGR